MPKRKHDEISRSEITSYATTDRALRLQRLQLDGLLNQSKKSLFRSLKVARGFERQKLGRRQKTAKAESNVTDTARLEAEVAALKTLDLASTAEIHLYRSLLKIKSIASASAIPHYVRASIDASKKPQQVASVNVQARLFKSGPVQAAMTEALKGIWAALGIEELKSNSKKRLRAKDYANDSQATDTNRPVSPEREGSSVSKSQAQDEDEWSGLSAPERPEDAENHDIQDDADENDEYDIYASRLAASSDESLVEEDVEGQNHDRDKPDDMSITEEEEDNNNNDAPEAKHPSATNPHPPKPRHIKPIKQTPTAPPTSTTTTTTTFLPSLSLGGYYSGSDSSSSSSSSPENKIQQVRKNRMGQQARRALWEKKFGSNANHVKKKKKKERARDDRGSRDLGWDARNGAQRGVADDGERGKREGRGRGGSRGGGGRRFAKSTGANSDPVGVRKAKGKPTAAAEAEEGPLHPSWEAARKKAKEKKNMAAAPFLGKKVIF